MIEMEFQYWLAGIAAVAAGAINALAGGGTLITFPTLLALGVSPITANVTNTVALCPGFIGGILAQRELYKVSVISDAPICHRARHADETTMRM